MRPHSSLGWAVLSAALAACTQRADDPQRDAGGDAAQEDATGVMAPERWSCFTEPNGDMNLEFPTENPMNLCLVNPYPEGGECYACALERCCARLLCCGNNSRANFRVPYTAPRGYVDTGLVYGCIQSPMECIQECLSESDAAQVGAPRSPAESRDVVLSCTESCIEAMVADPQRYVSYPKFPRYAREWVECLLSEVPDPLDADFSSMESLVPPNLPRPFAGTSCAAACFPGF